MKNIVIQGKFWHAGDRVFIEEKDEYAREVYNEVCLNELMKDNIKEESHVKILISFED